MPDLKQSVTSDSDPNSDPKSFRIHNIGENKNFLAKNKNALQVLRYRYLIVSFMLLCSQEAFGPGYSNLFSKLEDKPIGSGCCAQVLTH